MIFALLTATVLVAAPLGTRTAVLVGSNTAVAGRNPLQFAHRDAAELADVLIHNGGFAAEQVVVLLDPSPTDVLKRLRAAREAMPAKSGNDLLLFYYSGHADENALYPGGQALPLQVLRAELADESVSMRIGIIDACRGGSWTQAKGVTPTAPFSVGLQGLSSEGTALVASSSGLEDAHETDALGGSYFTHHFIAGLRGAADASQDSQVTLSEAFAYANRFTVRDTATRSAVAQHPSFDFRLRGRQDVVLTTVGGDTSQLQIAQRRGPLEIVQLSTGITLVEGIPGESILRLALPPGPYLVRRVDDGAVRSKEVTVAIGEITQVDESALSLVGAVATGLGKGVEAGHWPRMHVDVGVGPALTTRAMGIGATGGVSWQFSHLFEWQLLHATWAPAKPVGIQESAPLNPAPSYGVTAGWELDTAVSFVPTLFERSWATLSAELTAGAAVVGLRNFSQSPDRAFAAPGLTGSAALRWLFLKPFGWRADLGVVVSIRDTVAFASTYTVPLVTSGVGLQAAFGGP